MLSEEDFESALAVIMDTRKFLERNAVDFDSVLPSASPIDARLAGINSVVEQARLVIKAESSSVEELQTSDMSMLPFPRSKYDNEVELVIEKTIRAYSDGSATRLTEAEVDLKPYEGLPVHFDILALMGVNRNEAVFCQLLTWLLTPGNSHGVGDAFLRLFLARLGITSHGRIFDYSQTLNAEVISEVTWDVPNNEPFRRINEQDDQEASDKSRRLRVDILVVVQGYVIPIEVKVYASESIYEFHGERWSQAALYGEMWRLMLEAYRGSLRVDADADAPTPPSLFTTWKGALRKCIAANPGLQYRGHYFDGGRASVIPVLIHPRHQCRTKDQRMGERDDEHGLQVRHIDWLDIDRMLYCLSRDRDIQSGRLDLIRSFRTTILRLATGTDLVSKIEDLRLRIAEPALIRRFPLASSASLDAALKELNHVDTCCDEAMINKIKGKNHYG